MVEWNTGIIFNHCEKKILEVLMVCDESEHAGIILALCVI